MKQKKPELAKELDPGAGSSSSEIHHAPASARCAKIICTIGPACHSETAMRDLLRVGIDAARLNFSHGTNADHARNIERLRLAAEKENRIVCILQDLQGPKIRTGRLENHEPILLKSGSTVIIPPREIKGPPR